MSLRLFVIRKNYWYFLNDHSISIFFTRERISFSVQTWVTWIIYQSWVWEDIQKLLKRFIFFGNEFKTNERKKWIEMLQYKFYSNKIEHLLGQQTILCLLLWHVQKHRIIYA